MQYTRNLPGMKPGSKTNKIIEFSYDGLIIFSCYAESSS